MTISTHSFDKESYSPFETEQLTEHLLNKQRKGYKQIVVNLKNGETVTSGFCDSDFFETVKNSVGATGFEPVTSSL